nr:putative glucose-6-phosphate 1-epimerase [Ipomoea batatas]
MLFVSSKAIFKPPKAIRGGIPICFPQFSNLGPLEQHGFARNRFWTVDKDPPPFPPNSRAFIDLILKPSEDDLKIWPHRFGGCTLITFWLTFIFSALSFSDLVFSSYEFQLRVVLIIPRVILISGYIFLNGGHLFGEP